MLFIGVLILWFMVVKKCDLVLFVNFVFILVVCNFLVEFILLVIFVW